MTLIQKIQKLRAKKGFTLVELIVVIAILAVLMAILIPTMMNFVENSRIQSANTTAKNYFDTTKQYVTDTEAAAKGILKGTAGNLVMLYTITNTDGKSASFVVTAGTYDGTTVAADADQSASVEGAAPASGTKWSVWNDGLQAHLAEQMPNAEAGSSVLVELKEGAVVQTVYSNSALTLGDYTTLTIDNIYQGKDNAGSIVGSSPSINADVERPTP